jgi:NADP-dependent aldehyde dehydrogenase
MQSHPILIDGHWVPSDAAETFQAFNPTTGQAIDGNFPVSRWSDCDRVLNASVHAFEAMRSVSPSARADFLDRLAGNIEVSKEALVAKAHEESGLAVSPRLADVELPRTINQLRQAAAAARTGSWSMPTIDTKARIRSIYEAFGPVCVFGPNNFPFAYNGAAGGDFAAAIAVGNPVIAKANTSHPGTTKLLAELVLAAMQDTKMPSGLVQLIYRTSHEDGLKLVSDHRIAATGYTGSRQAGLRLKAAADAAGKQFYAELSSVNPVVILPGALAERMASIVDEYVTSGLMGAGQFCTNPGLLLVIDDELSQSFIAELINRYKQSPSGTLLSKSVQRSLTSGVETLRKNGAKLLVGGEALAGSRCAYANTLLHATGEQFLKDAVKFQTEAFGNAALIVSCRDRVQLQSVLKSLEGNLTGCIYTAKDDSDDDIYSSIAPILALKVGRFLNDKMPTGVAVSPAMNHGGPYPATGHPGFTAVGFPGSMLRFAKLTSYDAVRLARLPKALQNANPTGETWRNVDGRWSLEDVTG